MYRNSNREVIKELAHENYQIHRTRNHIAILAITLTTLLITTVLTVGVSFTSTVVNYGESAPGPGAEGSVDATIEQAGEIKKLPQVEWADYIQKCSSAQLHNEEFAGMEVWLMAPEESYYKHNYVNLIQGTYPKSGDEILISDSLAKRLGMDNPVGEELELNIMISGGENMDEKEVPLKICGYYKNPLVSIKNIYDEIYTTSEFMERWNPEMMEKPGEVFIHLNNFNPFLLKSDVMDKLYEVNHAVGGYGIHTKYTDTFGLLFFGAVPALLFVFFMILSGYFLIYNVFYISVSADIRWFGMMKTIGTTSTQLKRILMYQAGRMAFIGVMIGVVTGYLIGNMFGPRVMAQTMYGQFYRSPNLFIVMPLGAIFSWFTVYISSVKSFKMASAISPVEAARYVPKKRRNIFTIISFALSGIIFMVACNATFGYSVNHMVERYNQEDCRIDQRAAQYDQTEPYMPISRQLVDTIKALPYVETVDVFYQARTVSDTYKTSYETYYRKSLAAVKPAGKLKSELDALGQCETFVSNYGDMESYFTEQNDVLLAVNGMPIERMEKELKYTELSEGTVDIDLFSTGDYILWKSLDYRHVTAGEVDESRMIHPGDTLELAFYDDERGGYFEKAMTVMAVIEKTDMYGTATMWESNIIMPDHVFQEIYPDYDEKISNIQIKTVDEITKSQHEEIQKLIGKEYNPQISMESRYQTRSEYIVQKQTFGLIGLFLTALLGIIGISNMANTITSDILARKIELATMQSIGMTKKQLWGMLFVNSMRFSLIALAIMIPVGSVLSMIVANNSTFTGFSIKWFVISILLLIMIILGISVAMTSILVKVLNKKSVVERLREIE